MKSSLKALQLNVPYGNISHNTTTPTCIKVLDWILTFMDRAVEVSCLLIALRIHSLTVNASSSAKEAHQAPQQVMSISMHFDIDLRRCRTKKTVAAFELSQ